VALNCTLLISTYNSPRTLELILETVLLQTVLPNEVLIADDGSGEETRLLIEGYIKKFPVPLIHIWHEDKGFRKAIIINKAIAQSKYEYIIQIDGDILLHKNFVEDHLHFATKGLYLFGTRVHVKKSYVPVVLKNKKIQFHFFSRGLKNRFRRMRILSIATKRKDFDEISPKLRGCNMSFWKEDFIKVNGANELCHGWGREDSELVLRFHNIGLKGKRLVYCAICYHLDHNDNSREFLDKNDIVEQNTRKNKLTYAEHGINKYLQ
jgi:glycosyltransferase involved in cell wall biosynthesis